MNKSTISDVKEADEARSILKSRFPLNFKYNKDSFGGTFAIILITAILTGFFSNLFQYQSWERQAKIEASKQLRNEQLQNIAELVQETGEIQMLREKVYWNKYYGVMYSLIGDYQKSDEFSDREDNYRQQYEDVVSKYFSSMYVSHILFEIDREIFLETETQLNDEITFSLDIDEIKTLYFSLVDSEVEVTEIMKTLENKAEDGFTNAFYEDSMSYVYELEKLLENK